MTQEQMIRQGAQALAPELRQIFISRVRGRLEMRPVTSQAELTDIIETILISLSKRTQS